MKTTILFRVGGARGVRRADAFIYRFVMSLGRSTMEFPVFKYHPDPRATGAVVAGDSECPCCKSGHWFRVRGHPIYAVEEVEDICPWCIASGEAARCFDAHVLR
jgi:uncharacterized protein CbrC (UPF0167 family)